MEIRWVRGKDDIDFNRPSTWFILGTRGSGKSSFLETLGCYYLQEGHTVLDLFGSRDGEGLAWLRSPYMKGKKALLLCGESVDVQAPCDVKKASALGLSDFSSYDIIISASPLYLNPDDEFVNAAAITDKVYKRLSWSRLIYCIVREAANFYYSRLKVSDNQVLAKSLWNPSYSAIALGST
jgi:energy-coupling factor transporter ATP-binding protein EcfA2